MRPSISKCLSASFLAGLIPAVLAPILWPGVLLLVKSQQLSSGFDVTAAGLLAVALFALIGGLAGSLLLGFPSLLLLESLRLNYVPVAAIVGAMLGGLLFMIFGPGLSQAPLRESWPLYVFFALLGGLCGMAASYLSRTPGAEHK